MKKVSKAILIGLAVLVALVVALLVGLNLYVQSPGAQARIQEELSKSLRLPLKITNTSLTPWSDLRITGISIPNGDANFLEATSFTARYRLLPLLEGKLVITEMEVENPKVIWVQNADGKWKLPEPEKAAAISKEEGPATPPPTADAAPSTTEIPTSENAEKTPKSKSEKKSKNFAVTIDRFEVKDGTFELFDKDRKPAATFHGVNMTYTKLNAEQIEGTATIGRAVWADGYTLENVRTPFSYVNANQELWFPELTATFAGGTLRGNYRSRLESQHTRFICKAEFDHINLDPLVVQGGGEVGQASGEIRGKFEMRGDTDRMEKAEGEGSLELKNGRFRQFEFFQAIGRVFSIREFADFYISEGHAEFRLAGEKLVIERVALQASRLEMTGQGTVRLDKNDKKDRKLSLDARLSVDDAIMTQLPGKLAESFASDGQGRRVIDFKVGGTTDKPKTDLDEKLLNQTINSQLGGLFGDIFDSKKEADMARKKEEDRRKKEEDERKKAEKGEKKEKKKKDKDKSAASSEEAARNEDRSQPSVTTPNP